MCEMFGVCVGVYIGVCEVSVRDVCVWDVCEMCLGHACQLCLGCVSGKRCVLCVCVLPVVCGVCYL